MSVWDEALMDSRVVEPTAMEKRRVVRRRRADFGSIKASTRDFELLGFIGEQYAVTLPQLAKLMGRRVETARSLRDRWKRAGWVESAQLAVAAPSFVWLTRTGAAFGSSPFRVWEPNHGLATHIQAVTDIRILLERDMRLGEWECERSVARTMALKREGRVRGHLPDGVLHGDIGRVAVEVELTLKSHIRLTEIINALIEEYDEVWYFVPERLERTLTEVKSIAPRQNIRIQRYQPGAAPSALTHHPADRRTSATRSESPKPLEVTGFRDASGVTEQARFGRGSGAVRPDSA
jgi:hypothetical protein